MKMYRKTLSFVLLLLSLTLILADYGPFPCSDTLIIKSLRVCSDISDTFEHSHSHGTEDNLVVNETKLKSAHTFIQVDFISNIDINLKSNFISKIWQPPKQS